MEIAQFKSNVLIKYVSLKHMSIKILLIISNFTAVWTK